MPDMEYYGRPVDPRVFGKCDIISGSSPLEQRDGPEKIVSDAIEDHIEIHGKDPFLGDDVGIIVNDRNRPTPTYLVLEALLEKVPELLDGLTRVHIATGTHKEPTEDDLRTILGKTYGSLRKRVHVHIATSDDDHIPAGRTKRGTDVRLDREIFGHDLLIMINSVEPHYFAGYTGGRKSLLPGMAWFNTVEMNHSNALDPGSCTLGLEGNPVHEDMEEAIAPFLEGRRHITFQLVQGPGRLLTDMVIGDIFSALREGVKMANMVFCIPMEGRYDIVVSFARPPMDRTLYQAQKAIENAKIALKDGGTIVLIASCYEGIGKTTFWDLLRSSDDAEGVLRSIKEGYKLGYHKAAKIAQLSLRSRILMVSEIPPEVLAEGFIEGHGTVEEAMKAARAYSGDQARTLVIPDGTMTVPLPREV